MNGLRYFGLIVIVCWNFFANAQSDSLAQYLNLSLEELLSLEVTTAGKQEQKIAEIPASVVVITKTDIETNGYQSLMEILSNALGMYKLDDYRNVSFGVRGFYSNVYNRNIVFLINGVVQKQPYQNWNDLNLMNVQVEAIQRIEFVRGPVALFYGNDAFFGAINIITTQKEVGGNSSVNVAYGSRDSYRANMQVSSNTEHTSANFAAGCYRTDGRNVPFDKIVDSLPLSNGGWIKNGSTKGYFKQESAYFNLNVDHKGFYASASYDKTYRNLIHIFTPVYDNRKPDRRDFMFRAELGCRKKLTPILSVDFHSFFERFNITNNIAGMLVNPIVRYGFNKGEMEFVNTELVANVEPNDKLKITLGANYAITPSGFFSIDVPAVGYDRMVEQLNRPSVSYAVFSQVEFAVSKKVKLFAGVRADKQEEYGFKNMKYQSGVYTDTVYSTGRQKVAFIPRLALVYIINRNNSLKLMYSEAISRPGIFENSHILWVPQPPLDPQLIKTAEVNYISLVADHLTINTSFFYNRLSSLITRRSVSDFFTGTYRTINNNSGEMETIGGEVEVTLKPARRLLMNLSLSCQRTKNLLFDNDAAYSPNVLAYFRANYSLTKDQVVALNGYYVGSMLSEWDETPVDPLHGDMTPKGRIAEKTPSYINLGANYRYNDFLKKGFYFNVHVENLLNWDVYYAPTPDNFPVFPNGTLEAGVRLNVAVGLKF